MRRRQVCAAIAQQLVVSHRCQIAERPDCQQQRGDQKVEPRLNFMQTLDSVMTVAAVQQEGLIKNEAETLRWCHSVTWRDSTERMQP